MYRVRQSFWESYYLQDSEIHKQTLHQKKALDLSFNLASWTWAWHYYKAATPSCPKVTFFTPRACMLWAASRRGALLMMPRPLSVCQIKAEIKGFLLRYCLFLYYQWFFQNIEKRWRKIFEKEYFHDFQKMMKFTKKNSLAFFNILKEPLLVQKQTTHQQKALDLSFHLTP